MQPERRSYKYYDFVMATFVTVLVCSNIIGATKVASVDLSWLPFASADLRVAFSSGVLFFPISYIFGDILTEVYGYARARRVVWAGFAALIFMSFMSWVVVTLPPDPGWKNQAAYETVIGLTPRIAFASIIAFWCGEFANSFVLAKLKVWMEGRRLWVRTIGSTIVGEGIDSLVFYPLAFLGVWETALVIKILIAQYILKTTWEIIATPVTYRIVAFLKKAEAEDYYDRQTNFTPFSIQT